MKMKNKREEQIIAKQKHRDSLRAKRREQPILERQMPSKSEKPLILIVCEGKNTEPSYFRQFKLVTATVVPVGEGYNTISLVNRANYLAQKRDYDQVWCVFDKDDFPDSDFNNAIITAQANNFGVAYSNQSFEYWLILHFDDHQGGGMNRGQYNSRINSLLSPYNIVYEGDSSKVITSDLFELLEGIDEKTGRERKLLAIDRAKRNAAFFNYANPAREESSTTVYKLVEELIKYC
ncbi:MAG: hypothetical protein CFE24_11430 [Flavobacterium sp. BFFFF2]|nr:MAG: hypothetical protein CFE24_11430 [Flavobacterium sp. BFFFF2]